ncbi:MAG: ATP-dependent DNA helicase [Ignavibacteria bacterium CG2_30_36_16]|nr:ATP-dependent DNA helicase RecQ [Ignavibacteria bacterium]OIP56449.1 MAG: ATP-dependent DNA helicase [Ignavibacteria bacterium CG2_30_36_16]
MTNPINILQKYFGFDSLKGEQENIINRLIYDGGHSLVLMPTGSGKSLCYQIPGLYFDGGTIVLSPLIALMQDQVDTLRRKNIPASFINSTVSRSDREKRLEQFIKGNIKLLYVTPERFRIPEFVNRIKEANISLLAVDEAHCISEWGHDFRPDYSRIGEFRELLGNPLTVALTATATPDVQEDIIRKLHLNKDEMKIFHQGIDRPNLRLKAVDVFDDKEKLKEILNVLDNYSGSGIIYFALIQTLEKFSLMLRDKGYKHGVYHGKLPDRERKIRQREFLNGTENFMLATNAFGMGIDKPDIRFVIHAEAPSSIEAYYQEIGRAGRDGNDSLCLLLYNQEDLYTQMQFIKWSNPGADYYSALYDILNRESGAVNSMGIEYIREKLSFKNRSDFRLETALNMMDRYSVTEGDVEHQNIKIINPMPEILEDDEYLKEKLLGNNKKLLSVVNYFRGGECRRVFISGYFGFYDEKPCHNCDNCDLISG